METRHTTDPSPRESYAKTRVAWDTITPEEIEAALFYRQDSSRTATLETARLHGIESIITLQEAAESLEKKLGIAVRWTEASEGWKEATRDEATRSYFRALEHLENLAVQRMFELTKLNQAGTGKSTSIAVV